MAHFETTLTLRCPLHQVFDFHTDERNLSRISPSFPEIIILNQKELRPLNREVTLLFKIFGVIRQKLKLQVEFIPSVSINDEQREGPFTFFRHSRNFREHTPGVTTMHEIIDYDLPYGPLGIIFDKLIFFPQLRRMFAYRHKKTKEILEHR